MAEESGRGYLRFLLTCSLVRHQLAHFTLYSCEGVPLTCSVRSPLTADWRRLAGAQGHSSEENAAQLPTEHPPKV